MKALILLFATILLSCTADNISTEAYNPGYYTIETISSPYNGLCSYHAQTDQLYTNFENFISFTDSIGKFTVGDKIVFKAIKLE